MAWRKTIPWSLVAFRFLLGPALPLVARDPSIADAWLGVMVLAGFVSDVFDGVLARRWNTASFALRVADSAVDIVFYLGVLAALVDRHWPAIHARLGLLAAVMALETINVLVSFIKFRRMASYHSYAAKFWGFLLAASTVTLLTLDHGEWLLTLALAWGIASELEVLAMSLLLPEWTHDVKTLARAIAIRQKVLARESEHIAAG